MLLMDLTEYKRSNLFPMNQNAQDLMMKAPAKVEEKHLKELSLKIDVKNKN